MTDECVYIIVSADEIEINPHGDVVYHTYQEAERELNYHKKCNKWSKLFVRKLERVLDHDIFKYKHDILYDANCNPTSKIYKKDIVSIIFDNEFREYDVFFWNYKTKD